MRKLLFTISVLIACTGCGPNHMKRLRPIPANDSRSLTDLCLKVEVTDEREDQDIYEFGAFNMFGIKAEGHTDFIKSEFEMAATARGAEFGPCWDRDHLNKRSVQVAIRDLVLDSAWGWPITAFEFDIALDVEAANDSRTMKHELKKNYSTRFGFGLHTETDGAPDGLPERCSLEARKLIESFYDNSQVEAFLKENIKLPEPSATAQKNTANQPEKKVQGAPKSDISKKLTTLFEMKKEGLITDEEYAKLKEKIISEY